MNIFQDKKLQAKTIQLSHQTKHQPVCIVLPATGSLLKCADVQEKFKKIEIQKVGEKVRVTQWTLLQADLLCEN